MRKVIFDYCGNCQGIWLDSGQTEAIQKGRS
ncbi:MAG: zf-TFIIB domain-containing protein [Bacteroidales bacterium]